jgi:hypothetical protein
MTDGELLNEFIWSDELIHYERRSNPPGNNKASPGRRHFTAFNEFIQQLPVSHPDIAVYIQAKQSSL